MQRIVKARLSEQTRKIRRELGLSQEQTEEFYRVPMRVEAVRAFRWGNGFFSYPVCPRCDSTMEREYQSFCDRCGQRLSRKAAYRKQPFSLFHPIKRELLNGTRPARFGIGAFMW